MTTVKIKEDSWLAKIAAKKLNSSQVAMVIGKTIYLYNSSKENFLNNPHWVRHEVAHVKQYSRYGLLTFIILYLFETFNKGYKQNSFEVEAREKEKDATILSEIEFL
jgi:hypothetical protein